MIVCSVAKCERKTRSATCEYCEAHYYRIRRNGHLNLKPKSERWEQSAGYIMVKAEGHPLKTAGSDYIYEHRKVYYDAKGSGPFNCHVCNKIVGWDTMHVDHLNDIVNDNRIENLAPCCPVCNQTRGRWKMVAKSKEKHGITLNGATKTINEWAKTLNISSSSIRTRINNGWSLERALTQPRGRTGPQRTARGE